MKKVSVVLIGLLLQACSSSSPDSNQLTSKAKHFIASQLASNHSISLKNIKLIGGKFLKNGRTYRAKFEVVTQFVSSGQTLQKDYFLESNIKRYPSIITYEDAKKYRSGDSFTSEMEFDFYNTGVAWFPITSS